MAFVMLMPIQKSPNARQTAAAVRPSTDAAGRDRKESVPYFRFLLGQRWFVPT